MCVKSHKIFTFSSKFIMLNSASFANFVPRGSRNSLSFLMRAATASEAAAAATATGLMGNEAYFSRAELTAVILSFE